MQLALYTQDQKTEALVGKALASAGLGCLPFSQLKQAVDYLQKHPCGALILDGECREDFSALLTLVRNHLPPEFPVFALMPPAAELIVAALEQRVTDYLVKPLRQAELTLRVRVALQRCHPDHFASSPQAFGDYVFDEANRALRFRGQAIDLTHKEFALALLFFRHLNRPLSRAFIVERIWSRDMEVSSRTVDTHVSRVRSKLSLTPENGFKLAPVYSFGYRLEQSIPS